MSTSRGLYNLVIVTARKRKGFEGWRLREPNPGPGTERETPMCTSVTKTPLGHPSIYLHAFYLWEHSLAHSQVEATSKLPRG